ncbi:hypothetical protein EMIT0210MI2_12310 [Priestia megaterium]
MILLKQKGIEENILDYAIRNNLNFYYELVKFISPTKTSIK